MKIKYLITLIIAPILFCSCEDAKKEEAKNTPSKAEKKPEPTAKKQPPRTGIPAVEAARRIGNDLDKEAKKSRDLLEGTMGK